MENTQQGGERKVQHVQPVQPEQPVQVGEENELNTRPSLRSHRTNDKYAYFGSRDISSVKGPTPMFHPSLGAWGTLQMVDYGRLR